jgi:large subunit ribosomal protein L20
MPRATYGAARNRKKKRLLRRAKGFRGARSKLWRTAKEAVLRAESSATRDRRRRKRDFRSLWVTRLTAACRARDMAYSRFIFGLHAAGIELNRKVLSEMAIHAPDDFDALVAIAREHQPAAQQAA